MHCWYLRVSYLTLLLLLVTPIRPGMVASPVPGCLDKGVPGRDYCFDESETTLRLRSEHCVQSNPCSACQGDCDSDMDCEGTLLCQERSLHSKVDIAGCEGTGIPGLDYCYISEPGRNLLLRRVP